MVSNPKKPVYEHVYSLNLWNVYIYIWNIYIYIFNKVMEYNYGTCYTVYV